MSKKSVNSELNNKIRVLTEKFADTLVTEIRDMVTANVSKSLKYNGNGKTVPKKVRAIPTTGGTRYYATPTKPVLTLVDLPPEGYLESKDNSEL